MGFIKEWHIDEWFSGFTLHARTWYDQNRRNPDTVPITGMPKFKIDQTNRIENSKVFPTFDPKYGFPNGRKERGMNISA